MKPVRQEAKKRIAYEARKTGSLLPPTKLIIDLHVRDIRRHIER
jgi:hypothetical protein